MSTRSRIGIQDTKGIIRSVYCHWDGYVDGNGKILLDHYRTDNKVSKLIDNGDLSILGKNIGSKHPFDNHSKDQCTFYGRDRNESGTMPIVSIDKNEFLKTADQGDAEYIYLFASLNGKDKVWFVNKAGYGNRFVLLSDFDSDKKLDEHFIPRDFHPSLAE